VESEWKSSIPNKRQLLRERLLHVTSIVSWHILSKLSHNQIVTFRTITLFCKRVIS